VVPHEPAHRARLQTERVRGRSVAREREQTIAPAPEHTIVRRRDRFAIDTPRNAMTTNTSSSGPRDRIAFCGSSRCF
jgi:hypothetical protein